jgi:hypothetical protein
MHYSFRKIVALMMLLVISLTVLSPDFAWEATTSDVHRDAEINAQVVDAHDVESGSTFFEQHDDHPCGCHMFSHLPIQVSDTRPLFFPKHSNEFSFLVNATYSSQDSASIDRPPKSSLA